MKDRINKIYDEAEKKVTHCEYRDGLGAFGIRTGVVVEVQVKYKDIEVTYFEHFCEPDMIIDFRRLFELAIREIILSIDLDQE